LCRKRRLAAADGDIVAVEGDVDGSEVGSRSGPLLDQPGEAPGERHAARLDADHGELVEVGRSLDDLVRDPGQRPRERRFIEEDLPRHLRRTHGATRVADERACMVIGLLSGLAGPG